MSLLPNLGSIGSGVSNFYNETVTTSLRVNAGHTLTKAFGATPTSATTMSFGGWVKFSDQHYQNFFSATLGGSGVAQGFMRLDSNLKFNVDSYDGSAYFFNYTTTRVFRDTSAWYHIWVQIDTTDGTAADRVKLYIDGVRETAFDSPTHVSSGSSSVVAWNTNVTHYIGNTNATYALGGYVADWWFLDGQDVSPIDTVGEFKNGVFIPKEYSATFGNKGFHLKFIGTGTSTSSGSVANPTNIGDDSSGQNNHWAVTSSGILSHDANLPDSPENNFCTMGSSTMRRYGHSNVATMAEGNLKATTGGNATHAFGTMSIKQILANGLGVYFEMRCVTDGSPRCYFGIVAEQENNVCAAANAALYEYPLKFVIDSRGSILGGTQTNGTAETNIGAGALSGDYSSIFTVAAGDVMGVAIKSDGKVFISKNGTFVNSLAGTSNPATGANPIHVIDTTLDWFPINGYHESAWHANFGQDGSFSGTETSGGETDSNGIGDFFSAVPSGFVCLSSVNMAETTIGPNSATQADDYFKPVLYSGLNSTAQNVTVGFQPDWVWIKTRNAAISNMLYDSNRGETKFLQADAVGAEGTGADSLTDFTPTDGTIGFSLGADSSTTAVNNNGKTYVSWNWKANGGTATATISESGDNPAAVVQANPTAGFSLITYTGTGDSGTIAHGLSAVPTMMIIKNRDVGDAWAVYHGANTAAPGTDYLVLNTNAATADAATYWADTAPTSSVFTVHDAHNVNADGEKYVAYVFADVEGYSKMGSYVGNGSADGTFVFTGFDVSFLMRKRTDSAGNWVITDSARDPDNISDENLYADLSYVEYSGTETQFDFLSNGFKMRGTWASTNASGATYIYMAFAENPFKYANAK